MNLLNLQIPKTHFYTLLELIGSGHNVYSNWHGDHVYENALGIKTFSKEDNDFYALNKYYNKDATINFIEKFIDHYNIDVLQVADPGAGYLHTHFKDKIKYIGPSEESTRLESDKLFAKEIANSVGIKTPAILKKGKYGDDDYCTNLTFPAIEKCAHHWNPAVNLFNEKDAEKVIAMVKQGSWPRDNSGVARIDDEYQHSALKEIEYFIEEYIDDMIETNVFFVIANGEYKITHTQQIIGENLNKTVDERVWYIGSYIKPLKPEVDKIVRKNAEKFLEKAAKMGGNYEGSFCGAYTSTGDWYFLEMNVRPDIFNSTPTFMSGDDYLKGMFEDISLFEKAWEDIQIEKLLITSEDLYAEYPYHLHVKHNVLIPNNLIIKDNKFYMSDHGTDETMGAGTIIASNHIPKEFIKEVEETTCWKFNEEPI